MEITEKKLKEIIKQAKEETFKTTFKWVNYVVQNSDNYAQFKDLMKKCAEKMEKK